MVPKFGTMRKDHAQFGTMLQVRRHPLHSLIAAASATSAELLATTDCPTISNTSLIHHGIQ
jgi:hypothetical protein